MLASTQDANFPVAGARAAVRHALPAYAALGGTLELVEAEYVHGLVRKHREALYAFLARALGVEFYDLTLGVSVTEHWPAEEGDLTALFDEAELQVTSTGSVASAPECIALGVPLLRDAVNARARALGQALRARRQAPSFFDEVRRVPPPQTGCVPVETHFFPAGGLRPAVVVHVRAGPAAAETSLVRALAARGVAVLAVAPCGLGADRAATFPPGAGQYKEMASSPDLAMLLGSSVVELHAADVRAALERARELGRVAAMVVADQLSAAALRASLSELSEGRTPVPLAHLGACLSYESLGSARTYSEAAEWMWQFGVLRKHDLPDLMAALAPLPQLALWPDSASHAALDVAAAVYTTAGAGESFRVVLPEPGVVVDEVTYVLAWVDEVHGEGSHATALRALAGDGLAVTEQAVRKVDPRSG